MPKTAGRFVTAVSSRRRATTPSRLSDEPLERDQGRQGAVPATDELRAAWDDLHAATPAGWHVGWPGPHPERGELSMYAFDPTERPVRGHRLREWTAIAPTELGVLREMVRCLRELGDGRTAQ